MAFIDELKPGSEVYVAAPKPGKHPARKRFPNPGSRCRVVAKEDDRVTVHIVDAEGEGYIARIGELCKRPLGHIGTPCEFCGQNL